MDFISENLLTILILLPLVGAVLTLVHQMVWKQEGQLKWLTLGFGEFCRVADFAG